MVLSMLRDTPEFAATAHLTQVLDRENFNRLIDTMGGMRIAIPTRDEYNLALKSILFCYYHDVRGMDEEKAREMGNIDKSTWYSLAPYTEKVSRLLERLKKLW